VTWRRELTRASGIGISGFSVTRKSRQEKSRNSETRRSQSHSQVSTHIGVRDLEGSVDKCYGNRDIPTRDFPITTGVWAIGARVRDRCWKVNPRWSQRQVASEIGIREIGNRGDKESMRCETPNPETPMSGLIMVTR
jgi:hypothetical protein